MATKTPVTLLTGFLGSGKTTLVNHLLTQQTERRIAVVVNEFGEFGIDAALITNRSGDVLELANGCVCCASRGELTRATASLVSAGRDIDHVLVECSGLADPGPVIESLVSAPLSDRLSFTGTVACVDAANFDRNLEHAEAAYNQLTHADLLIINKTDLVGPQVVAQIEKGLRLLNATATQIRTVRCAVPVAAVLGPRTPADRSPAAHGSGSHALISVTVGTQRDVDPDRLRRWLGGLPETVVRAKGIVRLAGDGAPRAVQVVSGTVSLEDLPPGGYGEADRSVLVLIGTALDAATLQEDFARCAD